MKKISFFKNHKNREYKVEDFKSGKNNILYVTGLSGSGKTTFCEEVANQFHAMILPLDCLGEFYGKYKNSSIMMKRIVQNFFDQNKELEYIISSGNYMNLKLNHFDKYCNWNQKYIQYVSEYCKGQEKSNFLIEGTHLFMTMSASFYQNSSIIIIGTSAITSFKRRLGRELSQEEKRHPITKGKKHIKKLCKDARRLQYQDVKKLNLFLRDLMLLERMDTNH